MSHWRKPHTIPIDGKPVICAYRWSKDDKLRVTVGCWFTGGEYPGIVDAPDGSYIPCIGWMPMPEGETHDEFLPLNLRRDERSTGEGK